MKATRAAALALAVAATVTGVTPAPGQSPSADFTPSYRPHLEVGRGPGEIRIDGDLRDPGWQGAARAHNFSEIRPGDQIRPPVETEAYLTYDDRHLYAAFVCYADPKKVRASLCEREQIFSDDNVGFFIDTYGEAAWAYTLNVNPYGIQADAMWTPNNGEDTRFDLVWESAARITDSGYVVEMAIPFASLRFPDREEQIWRVVFYRHHQRDVHHLISWAAFDRGEPCWPCQWGTIAGISGVAPGSGVELLPAVVGRQAGLMAGSGTQDSPRYFINEDVDVEASLGAKYALSSEVILEGTVNPDFSQVEGDAEQIDVNTTFALFYPERRPFFQEGIDLFASWLNVVYTRSINDPLYAAKVTARGRRTGFAFLSARDEHSPVIIPQEEASTYLMAGESYSNIARVKRTFGDDSFAGVFLTDRRLVVGGSGSLVSADGQFKLSKNFRLQWQAAGTDTREPDDTTLTPGLNDVRFDGGRYTAGFDGESFRGHLAFACVMEQSRHLDFEAGYWEKSPTYRPDNGFEPRNDYRNPYAYGTYKIYFDNRLLDRVMPFVKTSQVWNFRGVKKSQLVKSQVTTLIRPAQIQVYVGREQGWERFQGSVFGGLWRNYASFEAVPGRRLSLGGFWQHGHQIARYALAVGRETTLQAWAALKPVDRVQLRVEYDYTASDRVDTGARLFKGYVALVRVNFQFSRELSVRVVTQYNDFERRWNVEPLLTYRLSPFSAVYAGMACAYERLYGLGADCDVTDTRMSARQYLFQL
jgi:hypothetical protein